MERIEKVSTICWPGKNLEEERNGGMAIWHAFPCAVHNTMPGLDSIQRPRRCLRFPPNVALPSSPRQPPTPDNSSQPPTTESVELNPRPARARHCLAPSRSGAPPPPACTGSPRPGRAETTYLYTYTRTHQTTPTWRRRRGR
jgi:hypothetical protein